MSLANATELRFLAIVEIALLFRDLNGCDVQALRYQRQYRAALPERFRRWNSTARTALQSRRLEMLAEEYDRLGAVEKKINTTIGVINMYLAQNGLPAEPQEAEDLREWLIKLIQFEAQEKRYFLIPWCPRTAQRRVLHIDHIIGLIEGRETNYNIRRDMFRVLNALYYQAQEQDQSGCQCVGAFI